MERLAELLRQGADRIVNLPTETQRFVTNPQAFVQLLTGKNPLPRETGFAAGATGLPPQQGTILNPEYQAYMQGYEQGEPVSIAAMATPAAVPLAKALAPKAGQMAEQYMVNQGFMPSIVAYHGTPHKIVGKFDINKVGTGEGAQAYGHGMYFAESPTVAEFYKNTLKTKDQDIINNTIERLVHVNNKDTSKIADALKVEGFNPERITPELENSIKKIVQATDLTTNTVSKAGINEYANLSKIIPEQGNLYKVDIPDEYIPNMLDWDKPISQQSDIVKKALNLPEDKFAGFRVPATGTNYSFSPNMTGADFYKELTDLAKTQAGASKMLNSMGIKGIRYLDAGSRPTNIVDKRLESLYQKHGGDVEKAADDFMRTIHDTPKKKAEMRAEIIKDLQNRPTNNFVVFDPSTVQILEENAKPLARKELIKQELEKLEK